VASVALLAAIPPSEPLNLQLVSRSQTSLTFKWERPMDNGGIELQGYKVYVAEGSAAYVQVVGASSTTNPTVETHEHTSSNLTPG